MADPRESYQSPLNSRYASPEMKYNFSEKKKFSEWRKLWVILARAQRELGVQHDGRDITEEQGRYPALPSSSFIILPHQYLSFSRGRGIGSL